MLDILILVQREKQSKLQNEANKYQNKAISQDTSNYICRSKTKESKNFKNLLGVIVEWGRV